jgi:hypothetical protein
MPEMLGGDLAQVPLADILRMLVAGRQTGLLHLSDGVSTGELYMQEGELVHAVTGGQAGEGAVYALMAWQRGTFRFSVGTAAPENSIAMPTGELLEKGSGHAAEWREIKRTIPSADMVFRLSGSGSASVVSLEPEEWQVLAKVNGERDVSDIVEALRWDELTVSRVLLGLVTGGLLEVADQVRAGPTALVNGGFFSRLEEEYVEVVGPLGPMLIDDEIATMGQTREYFPRAKAAELVERISADIDDEEKRARFQQTILTLLRSL